MQIIEVTPNVMGTRNYFIALIFYGLGLVHVFPTTCPKNLIFGREHTFIRIKLQINIPQMLRYHTDLVEMCFPLDLMDIKVIYKYLKKLLQPFKKNVGYCPGKCDCCIFQPKWHHKPFM
jgi:hypothetical protein